MAIRTDLAAELAEGKSYQREETVREGFPLHTITVPPEATDFGRPPGRYATLSVHDLSGEAFSRACRAVAQTLTALAPPALDPDAPVLVIGLGNRAVTPDAVGPLCCAQVLATRHLMRQSPEQFHAFRPVSVLAPGVLGTTGIETGEIVRGLISRVRPSLLIAVDALAARRLSRLMHTIQLTDTGIVPGSGVGNARTALTRQALGIPVLAVGVPTVTDGATLAADIRGQTGRDCEALTDLDAPVLVTTRDADREIACLARVIGRGINLFLHPTLTLADIEVFLS